MENNDGNTLSALSDYSNEYSGRGKLKVQVSAARGNFPVRAAVVDVAAVIDGKRYTVFSGSTDSSGIVEGITLPAKPLSQSQKESTAYNSGAKYLVSVYHPAFLAVNDTMINIFDSVETILPVGLIPDTGERE